MLEEPESWNHLPARFGDRVRVRPTPETEATGIAGRCGIVYGITTVSVTGVDVIGSPTADVALNVALDELEETVWLAPDLVEFLNHNPGATITLVGVRKQWTADASGNWVESPRNLPPNEWFQWFRLLLRKAMRW